MSEPNQSTPAPVEPAPQAPPQQQQQAPNPNPQAPGAPDQPKEQKPSVEALTAKLAELETNLQKRDESYKHLQAEFTKRSQVLAQLMGQQPQQAQQDPLAPYVEKLAQKGYDKDDARNMLGVVHELIAPLQQSFQQQQQALQQTTRINDALQQAWNDPIGQSMLSDPEVMKLVRENLERDALEGMMVSIDTAIDYAAMANSRKMRANKGQPAQPVQRQANGPSFPSFVGPTSGYQPVQTPAAKPRNQFDDEIQARFGFKPNQS